MNSMTLETAHQTLEDLLTLPELEEDALDYMGCLGALAAFVITPKEIDINTITEHVLDETIDELGDNQLAELKEALSLIEKDILAQFEGEEDIVLPWMEDEDDEDALIAWAAGFVEVVFEHESLWLNPKFEEDATQLMMPIIAISGILEEETEDIMDNDELLNQWLEEIPDLLVDLFLLFRVVDEKKGPPKSVYGAGKKKGNPGQNNKNKRGSRGKKSR